MDQTTYLQVRSMGDGNVNSGNILNSFNNFYTFDEDTQIMRWLSPLEPNSRHKGVRSERLDGIGNWVLETNEFREWGGGDGGAERAVLFCSGNPGVGKTYLSSLVIDRLCDQAKKEDIAVAGLYCDFLAQQDQTITNMMGAILKQLVSRGGIPNFLREAFQEDKKEFGGRGLRLPDLMEMLSTVIASLPQVFLCIDALDECLPKHLPKLLESLRDIIQESPRTRIFLTGRPHIKEDVQRYFTMAVVVPVSPNMEDVRYYLEEKLAVDSDPEAMNDELRGDIMKIMVERMSDIFLLVSLNIDAILGEVTVHRRREKLEEMTKGEGLSDAYTETLIRLKAQKGNKSTLGFKVLMWVLYAERPLRTEEPCHALGVEIGSADLDSENVPTLRTLLASCLGLVAVEKSSSTVRLVHYTLQEHLSSDPTLFPSPHSSIAEVCLTYINFESARDLSPTSYRAPSAMPLLEYASCYWGNHAKKGMTGNMKTLALKLLDRFDEHICAQLLLLHHTKDTKSPLYFSGRSGPTGFTGLHGVAFLGIVGIITAVLEMKEWDVNSTDSTGSTALIWAAVRGHEEVVKALLARQDVNPNIADANYGFTPLSWAAYRDNRGVVRVLLEREDVDPNTADTIYGWTPLSWAVLYGCEGVVKMLLERENVNPNTANAKYGLAPLSLAAKRGDENVVKMLLGRVDVNPDTVETRSGRTPLSRAAEHGHCGIVKMLLAREDVNPNTADTEYARTPLLWAALRRHEGVVKILLERADVNPDQADTKYGQTALSWAAEHGHERIVKMLLQREDVDPNTADTKHGRTPLLWAAVRGRECVVNMLLERDDVNPDQKDTGYGRTPLSWAAEQGHGGVVKMLLDRVDVNPNTADPRYGRTALSWAAECGHEGVMKIILQRGDVNPDTTDAGSGRTPLSLAAERGYEGVVKVLLERGDVNPDTPDTGYGRTPLSWAAERGHEGVVRMLLERVDINPNATDIEYGLTPLSLAAERGHRGVVKILLEREDVNPNTADTEYGQTPLSLAAECGHEGVVRMLLGRRDTSTAIPDNEGQTPLSLALSKGYDRIVRMLQELDNAEILPAAH